MDRRQTDNYSNREIDSKFAAVHDQLTIQDNALEQILKQVTYTNGKLRKIIIAMVFLGGALIGLMGKDSLPILLKLLV